MYDVFTKPKLHIITGNKNWIKINKPKWVQDRTMQIELTKGHSIDNH